MLSVILLIPLGVDGGYSQGAFSLSVKIGPFALRLFPKKKKDPKPAGGKKNKRPKKKKPAKGGSKKNKKAKKEKKTPDIPQLLQIIKLGLKALGRFKRRLSIDYVRLRISVGSECPSKTALNFAKANALMGNLCPLAQSTLKMKEVCGGVYCDFLSSKTVIDFWLTATVTVLDILWIALAFATEFLILKIKKKIKQKRLQRTEERN